MMTSEDLVKNCRKMGLQVTDVEECMSRLDAILLSPDQPPTRKERALALLRDYSQGNTSEPGVIRAKRLCSIYSEDKDGGARISPPVSEFMTALHKLMYPYDRDWLDLLNRARDLKDPRISLNYGEHLVRMTNNTLSSPQCSGDTLLPQLKPLIDAVLTHLGQQLAARDRIQLEDWAAEITRLEEQASVARLQTQLQNAQAKHDWDEVENLAKELERMGQREMARSALAEVRAYRQWRHLFDDTIQVLKGYRCLERLAFPWDPTDPTRIELREVLDSVGGIEKWGSDENRHNWSQAIEHVSVQLLQRLQHIEETVEALETLQHLRRTWPVALGDLPLMAQWEALQTELQVRISTQVEEQLYEFRKAYDSTSTVQSFLDRNVRLRKLMGYAPTQYQKIIQEEQTLRTLRGDVQAWRNSGNLRILDDGSLDKAEHTLKELANSWSQAPLYEQLTKDMQVLRQELAVLDEASSYLKHGQWRKAIEILRSFSPPAAERLLRQAEQSMKDERVQSMIEAGRLAEIPEADLQAVSPAVRMAYEAVKLGQEYIATFRMRLNSLAQQSRFGVYSMEASELLQDPFPANARLSDPDEVILRELRHELINCLDQRAEQEAGYLRDECVPFPLLEPDQLVELHRRRDDLQEGLQRPGFDRKLAEVLQGRLAAPWLILEAQQACHDRNWERAHEIVGSSHSPLTPEHRRRLRATVLSKQYLDEETDDSAWMTLYREVPDLLLQAPWDQRHYLELIRRAPLPAIESLHEHVHILRERFPEEEFLINLLAFVADPMQRQEPRLSVTPRLEDEAVLQRLLIQWSGELKRYRLLRSLWESLDEPLRRQVWNQPESPPQKLQHTLEDRLRELQQALTIAAQDLTAMQEELTGYMHVGLLEDSPSGNKLLQQVDIALEIERRLTYLARHDPWEPGWQPELSKLEELTERFPLPVLQGRSWQQAINDRKRGIRAWDALDDDWRSFRGYFDGDDTGFHRIPEGWQRFINHLEMWCEALGRALPQLNWALPGARESRRWIRLRDNWQDSEEGRLWRERGEKAPVDLEQLHNIYNEVLKQTREFASLHAELLAVIPNYVSDPDEGFLAGVREPLMRLHRMQPLSRPVREIKQQLTDPKSNINIGSVYQRLFRNAHIQ